MQPHHQTEADLKILQTNQHETLKVSRVLTQCRVLNLQLIDHDILYEKFEAFNAFRCRFRDEVVRTT